MRARVLAAALALAAAAAGGARAAGDLTVDEAVRIARTRHPNVEAQQALVLSAHARVKQAVAGFLPFLLGSVAYNPQSANAALTPPIARANLRGIETVTDAAGRQVPVFCATPGEGSCAPVAGLPNTFALHSFWTATFGLAWTPWDWGQTLYNYRSSRFLARATEAGVTTTERDAALGARLTFFEVVAAEEQIKVGEESVTTYRRQLDQTRAFYNSGLRTGIDVATAESGLAAAELTLARTRAGLETAHAAFAAALGAEAWAGWHLVYEQGMFEIQPADETRARAPQTTLAETALGRRSELVDLQLQAESFGALAESRRGLYLPQLTFGIAPTWAGPDIGAMTPNLAMTIAVGYPLGGMSPLFIHGQIREAEGNLSATLARQRAERNAILQETADARALLAAAAEEVRAAHRLVDAATAQRDLAIGRYASGVGTIIELQNALLNYVSARFDLVQAGYDLAAARAQLTHALGED
jgi:outer membrane protein